jgi:hypothetical protein
MDDASLNPFNITKAVDFSDQEINDYWVDMPAGAGFAAMAKPTSPMPMFILGGKGSGKTHLMRYFSYPLQRIRYGGDVVGGIQKDKYLGIYLRCGGLNSARFKGKGQPDDLWSDVFAYYVELWLAQLVLGTVLDAVGKDQEFQACEARIVADVSAFIDFGQRATPTTLSGLSAALQELQKALDAAVNNSSITRTLPVHIAVTRGDLIFGIPRTVAAAFPRLQECLFLYLIDEFENLSEAQQKYVNTLLRERQSPCSFKIGAKLYGVRTLSTYSADEENKEGSEFEALRLDKLLRENDHYEEFAKLLIAKRLAEFNRLPSASGSLDAIIASLAECFEEPQKSRLSEAETAYVIEKYRGRERPYFKKLRQHLEQGYRARTTSGLQRLSDIDTVVDLLACAAYPLLEKVNLFLLYREWSSKHDLIESARRIATECQAYIKDEDANGRYQKILSYFKADLLAQLYRETDQRQRYVGLATFIEASCGLPRILLIILKHVFAWATFNGEQPFRGSPISIRSQQAGVLEAAEWFYRDARMIGRDGQAVMDAVNRLGTLFRGVRYSEKPSECSCSTFSADLSRSSQASRHVIDLAEKWSLLIDVGGQRDRNTERVDKKYQLNRVLAPRWDLSVYRRGVLALTPVEINAVFDPEYVGTFDDLAGTRIARMSAPAFGSRAGTADGDRGEPMDLFTGQGHD